MTLTQLRYIVAIIEADLNITLAAERVHATQSGLSKQLKLLEEELGLQIFARKGKSLANVTPAGAQVLARAQVILSEAANIRTLAAEHRQDAAGELVIATTQTQARFVLPHALRRLKDEHPAVRVRFSLFSDADGARQAEPDADVLIASGVQPSQPNELVIPLFHWRRVALVPAGHPLAGASRPLTLAELAAYPLIAYESALGPRESVAAAFGAAGLQPHLAYATHDTEVVKGLVLSGLGVGILPEMAVGDENAGLVSRAVEGLAPSTVHAVVRRDRLMRRHLLSFLGALAPHLQTRTISLALRQGEWPSDLRAPAWSDLASAGFKAAA